ncbi:MAG: 50S ribosomal protein L9 [Gammaproteobacteria bacterium]
MEVILLETIPNLGGLGDRVKVAPGYGRNFLIPKQKAVPANEANIAEFEARRAELERAESEKLKEAEARKEKMLDLSVVVKARSGDEGKLFGSIGVREISEAVTELGVELRKSEVHLSEGPIRVLGEHEVHLQLHSEVTLTIKVDVVPEETAGE